MGVTIERVKGRAATEAFLDLPFALHRDDPAWVPPLREHLRRRLSPRNPFFEDGTLELYAAKRGARMVGTVSALRDTRWETAKGEKTSFFGFFETEDDPDVAAALLDAASDRARAWGMATLRGPRNLTRVEEVGITVEGFDKPPPMLASHHPAYYQRLVEGLGLEKHHDVLAYDIDLLDADGRPRELPEKLKQKADAVDLPGLVLRHARWRTMGRDLADGHAVMTKAFETVPDVTPMPKAQFLALGRGLLAFSNTQMMQLAYLGDQPIAFAVCLPELNEAIARAHGHLLPTGWAGFLGGLRRLKTASFKLIGVLQEYRTSGVHAKLIEHVVEGLRRAGYQRLEASLIDERNKPMRAVVEGAGMEIYKRYRWYDRKLS